MHNTSLNVSLLLIIIFLIAIIIGAHVADDTLTRKRHSQVIEMMGDIEARTKLLEELCKE